MFGALFHAYGATIRQEPKARRFLGGALVDDVGVAVSAWAMQILQTRLFTDQRQRASMVLPMLGCFLAGSIVAGPLADWGARRAPHQLPRWRWRVIVWGRVVETLALGVAIWGVTGTPTIARVLPYFMISAFMKTALRPARIAFQVDLLHVEAPQLDAQGAPLVDESGRPLMYKHHLLSFDALTSLLRSAAIFGGLLLGGKILGAVGGRYAPLLIVDVATNLIFIAVIVVFCHPDKERGSVGDLWRTEARPASFARSLADGVVGLGASFRDVTRFLAGPGQRALLWVLVGAWMIEIVNEFYNGEMMVKHVLHGSDDSVRYAELVWSVVTIGFLALVPVLGRRVGSLGKIFLCTMLLDGVAIAVAGQVSSFKTAAQIAPFIAVLAVDKGLTATSQALASLAQNSASSAAMRGRIAAVFALVVIVSDMGAEVASTAVSEWLGIPGMVVAVGLTQVALLALVMLLGGRRLWAFGIHEQHR